MKRPFCKTLLTVVLAAVLGVGACFALIPLPVQAASEEPLMRIALFSDLHVEYDLQAQEKPIRPSTVKSVEYLRQITDDQGVDLILVGGDMSGGQGTWIQDYIPKTKDSVYETLSRGTKDGKVLFVTGNHDPHPSVKAQTPAGGNYSGDYSSYMLDHVGDFVSSLYADDVEKGISPYNELLCYRYTIRGIEFVGLNTPYLQDPDAGYGFYQEQTEWLVEEMGKIGKEKTVFLICHYPKNSLKTIEGPAKPASGNGCQADLNGVLAQYPNIIYCYGHVHGGDTWWAKISTHEVVRPEGILTPVATGILRNSGIINAHMGSMGYYKNSVQPDWLSAEDPLVCQFVTVDLYADRITFQSHNTGEQIPPQGTKEIRSLTLARDLAAQFSLSESEGLIGDESTSQTSVLTQNTSLNGTDTSGSFEASVTDSGSPTDGSSSSSSSAVVSSETNLSSQPSSDEALSVDSDGSSLENADDGRNESSGGAGFVVVLCVIGGLLIGGGAALLFLWKKKK